MDFVVKQKLEKTYDRLAIVSAELHEETGDKRELMTEMQELVAEVYKLRLEAERAAKPKH